MFRFLADPHFMFVYIAETRVTQISHSRSIHGTNRTWIHEGLIGAE